MTETIEIQETPAVETPAALTREDLQAGGLSPRELEMAEKQGRIAPAATEPANPAAVVPPAPLAPAPVAVAPKPNLLPDYQFTDEEQEKVNQVFGAKHPFRAFYWNAKKERHSRQAIEAKNRELEAENNALKGQTKAPEVPDEDLENQPLTPKLLKEIRARELAEQQKQRTEIDSKARSIVTAQETQEAEAKELYPDYDPTVSLAKEVIQNLDTMVPDRIERAKVLRFIKDLQVTAATADKLGPDDLNSALIAYEIGKFHPKYGKTTEDTPAAPPELPAGPKLSPEQIKKVQAAATRRQSSATIPSGSGKRVVSAEDVTAADFLKMDGKARLDFRKNHPALYKKLVS